MLCARSHSARLWSLTAKRSYTSTCQFKPIPTARNCNINNFRKVYFERECPVFLPDHVFPFKEIPAFTKWFTSTSISRLLDLRYIDRYADNTIVPLEFTQLRADDTTENFERFNAPLRLFLDSLVLKTQNVAVQFSQRTRLYLAQASISDLPPQLQDDLPAPSLVLNAGKGDIYNANIWMGMPPTNTPLHCDSNPNLFVQLAGRKRIRIYGPSDGSFIYQKVRMFLGESYASNVIRDDGMMRGEEKELLDRMVWDDKCDNTTLDLRDGFEAELGPGDGIFIPKRWWHSIKSTGISFTASVNWWFR